MKKLLALTLALLLLCGALASCGGGGSTGELKKGTIEKSSSGASGDGEIAAVTPAVRKELDDIYAQKLAATKAFAEPKTNGTVYYVSSINGNDSNSGKSPAQAWKTMANIGNVLAGDTVLFECGSVFRRTTNTTFFTVKTGMTLGTYGEGAKPIFYGSLSVPAGQWKAVSGKSNLYYFEKSSLNLSLKNDIGAIVFNGGEAWGIKIQMTYNDNESKQNPANRTLALEGVDNGLAVYDIPSYALAKGEDLKGPDLSFYHDYGQKRVYLYCEGGNPGERFDSVELSFRAYAFGGMANCSDITIQNLDFRNFGDHVIRTTNITNLTVQNCEFRFVGGTIQEDYGGWRNYYTRLGNAVENWDSCNGMLVENCYFDQIYDTALTSQSNSDVSSKNITYRNNVAQNMWFGVELWAGNTSSNKIVEFDNVDVSGNYFAKIGEGFTTQRPDKVDPGTDYSVNAFIKVSRGPYQMSQYTVTDNIVDGSNGKMLLCNQPKTNTSESGVLFDRNTYVGNSDIDFGVISGKKYPYTASNIAAVQAMGFEKNGKFYLAESGGTTEYLYKAANGVKLPFRLIFPDGFTVGKDYPLVTYLQIEAASGTDNQKNITTSPAIIDSLIKTKQAVVLVPQCPSGTWTGIGVDHGNYSTAEIAETGVMKAVAALIRDVAAEYQLTKKYAVGADAGAYAVGDLLVRHKDLLRAGILVAGAGDATASIGEAQAWILHGQNDDVIPLENAEALATAWGAELTTVWGLHDCWDSAATKDLIGWLLTK